MLGHSILSVTGTIGFLIALATLPLTYCVVILHLAACLSSSASKVWNLYINQSSGFVKFLVSCLSMTAISGCVFAAFCMELTPHNSISMSDDTMIKAIIA